VGMVMYFFLIGSVVRGSIVIIKTWETFRLRRVKELNSGLKSTYLGLIRVEPEFAQYLLWRDYFVEKVVQWRKRRPRIYLETLDRLGIDPQDPEANHILREEVEQRFAFSAYLATNIEEHMVHSIHLSQESWIVLLLLFGTFALCHRFNEVDLRVLTWFFLGVTVCLMLYMVWRVGKEKGKIKVFMNELQKKHDDKAKIKREAYKRAKTLGMTYETLHEQEMASVGRQASIQPDFQEKVKTHYRASDRYFMKCLQAGMFLISYVFAQHLMDFHGWQEFPQQTLLIVCLFTLVFITLTTTLRALVPTFLALMALPPYVDEGNLQRFLAVLVDDHNIVSEHSDPRVRSPSGESIGSGVSNHPHSLSHRSHAHRERASSNFKSLAQKVDSVAEELLLVEETLSVAHCRTSESGDNVSAPLEAGEEDGLRAVWETMQRLEVRLDEIRKRGPLPAGLVPAGCLAKEPWDRQSSDRSSRHPDDLKVSFATSASSEVLGQSNNFEIATV